MWHQHEIAAASLIRAPWSRYALLFAGLSVAAQVIAFLSLGALGDFGRLRKRVFAVCTWLGSASLIATLAVTPDRWWLAGAIVIVSNALFGIANLMYVWA